MKLIDGFTFYSTSDIAIFCGKSAQSITLWDKYSDQLEVEGQKRLIPKPIRLGGGMIKTNLRKEVGFENVKMEVEGKRMWSEEQMKEIVEFSKNLKRGDLARFNRERWGKKGEEIKERRKTKERIEWLTKIDK